MFHLCSTSLSVSLPLLARQAARNINQNIKGAARTVAESASQSQAFFQVRGYRVQKESRRTIEHRNSVVSFNQRREAIREDNFMRMGKDPSQRRSNFIEWNYDSELYALCSRLSEPSLDHSKLREAFSEPSWASSEAEKQAALGLDIASPPTNERLASKGRDLTVATLLQYLRGAYPYLPEEGVVSFSEYLTSEDVLAEVSYHIGNRDLILTEDYPPSKEVHRRVFFALMGALAESSPEGPARAAGLVLDLVAKQLCGVRHVSELWDVDDPMATLAGVLSREGRGEPVSRMLWVSGKETMMSCYHVGVYSDKEIIGQAPGESAEIAEEMAAKNALSRLFRLDEARNPFPTEWDSVKLRAEPNPSVGEWTEAAAEKRMMIKS